MSAFVGRKSELRELLRALGEGARLVTLTGSAGIGKTRLATELLSESNLRGYFCDLTHARDEDAMVAAVAEALELPAGGPFGNAGNVELALDALGPALLVLDNFEQILEAAPTLARWSEAASELRILVTSREILRLPRERIVELGPLALPDEDSPEEAESVQMLLGCARRLRHGLRLRGDDLQTVARIVEQLDGIPLALELAAPRLVFLGASTLLARLEERFALLRTSTGTLHGAIEWSWNLLDDAERQALAQCSVFRGGFDLDAAEAVLSVPDAPPVMDLLQSLFEKSLLRAEGDGRFGLYLSIREFAAEQLADAQTSLRHATYYASLGERALEELHGPETVAAWDQLREEKENLKAASRAELGDVSLRAALSLAPLMLAQGPYEEYDATLTACLQRESATDLEVLARIHRGDARRLAGRIDDAAADLDRALTLSQTDDLAALHGRALRSRGNVALVRGDLAAAAKDYEEALPFHRRAADAVHEALTLSVLGAALAPLGQSRKALEAEQAALSLLQQAGALREEGLVTAYVGNLFTDEGRFDEALVYFAQAEAIHDQLSDRFGAAFTTANRGILYHAQGRLEDAVAAYTAAVDAFRRVGARRYEGAFRGYLALATHAVEPNLIELRSRLQEAVQQLGEARDERFEALFLAYLGGCEAETGALERATSSLARAEAQIEASGDPFLGMAVRLQRGHLDLAEARRAEEDGDVPRAETLRAANAQRLAEANKVDPSTGDAPIERNADVLFSARTLRDDAPQVREEPKTEDALIVAKDASYFVPPGGKRIELEERHALRRTLRALVEARLHTADEALGREALVAAGWPGERMLPKAAANRLRVAISTLRKLGLQDVIITRRGAYLLHPAVPVREP
ncbi:MAG: tetratricopeptide repeat protein [Myxococcota bacterium]